MQLYTHFHPLKQRIEKILPEITVVSDSALLNQDKVIVTDPKTASELLKKHNGLQLFVLSDTPNFAEGRVLLQAGIKGYGNTYMHTLHLHQAITMIKRGDIWLYPQFIQQLIKSTIQKTVAKHELLEQMTEREREIALYVAQGLSNKEIASELDITERTVKAHISSLFEKIDVHDRLKLAIMLQ